MKNEFIHNFSDEPWDHSEFPRPLVTVDYDRDGRVIRVVAVGRDAYSRTYTCPKCRAIDSTQCDFAVDWQGQVKQYQIEEAREAGCRVQFYTDKFARTGSYFD